MKSSPFKIISPILAFFWLSFFAAPSHADSIIVHSDVGHLAYQNSDAVLLPGVYTQNFSLSVFNTGWLLSHSTPFEPDSVVFNPLLGAQHELTNLAANPSYSNGSATTPLNLNANAANFLSSGFSFSVFSVNAGIASSSPAALASYSVSLSGGAHDGLVINNTVDPSLLPALPQFSLSSLTQLDQSFYGPTITLDFTSFIVPIGATSAQRILQFGPLGGTTLDVGTNSFSFNTSGLTPGQSYLLSLWDRYTLGGTTYNANVAYSYIASPIRVEPPHAVPETGNPAAYLLGGLALASFMQARWRRIRR